MHSLLGGKLFFFITKFILDSCIKKKHISKAEGHQVVTFKIYAHIKNMPCNSPQMQDERVISVTMFNIVSKTSEYEVQKYGVAAAPMFHWWFFYLSSILILCRAQTLFHLPTQARKVVSTILRASDNCTDRQSFNETKHGWETFEMKFIQFPRRN